MDILINELSLDSQFVSIEKFITTCLSSIVQILKDIADKDFSLMKKYDFYNAKVTQSETIHNILVGSISREYDVIRKFKSLLIETFFECPYWQDTQRHSCEDTYLYNENMVSGSSLAESCERDRLILSFFHDDFKSEKIYVLKNSQSITICNVVNSKCFFDLLWDRGLLSLEEYVTRKFAGTKLDFSMLIKEKGFCLLKNKETANIFLSSFEKFAKMSWNNILKDNGFNYKQYDQQKIFAGKFQGKKIDKFRTSEKFRCFGYKEDEIFFVIQFEIDHKLSDQG